jgi:hypothetical protein
MVTTVHKVLGKERIVEICDNSGLSDEEKKVIEQILIEWENLVGKTEEKVSVVIKNLKNSPGSNPSKIYKALAEINLEFAVKANL